MEKKCHYGFGKTVASGFEETLARVCSLLEGRGFDILTRIDLQDHLQRELDIDFRRYVIIGACRPDFAHRAFSADHDIGLLLPCKVVVYEDSLGQTTVMAMDPARIMDMVRKPGAVEVAIDIKELFEELMANV